MKRVVLLVLAALGTAGLIGLGVWQLERRVWKLALIERVEQRVHAAPIAAPGPAQWPSLDRDNAEYLRLSATGQFLQNRPAFVQAVTTLGAGFWVMAPFQTDAGFIVLVNRGFVTPEQRDSVARAGYGGVPAAPVADTAEQAAGRLTLTGLLRMTEPNGGFLRANVPADDRWYSRDVAAISHAQHLSGTAPYFIDADASPRAGQVPVGGLTVVAFRNSHLLYAITWFTLALMVGALGVRISRQR
ncbi:MAG: SURF1 family protein [Gammaproteobacteria bacterium]